MSGYISNVPTSAQTLGQTQNTINNNFTQLNNVFAADHVDYTNAAPPVGIGGRHKTISLVQQAADPTAINTSPIVYSKSTTANTLNNDIYFRRASNDGSNVIQLTTSKVNPSSSGNGTSFLPGGIIIQWGTVAGATNGQAVTFPVAFPTAAFMVTATIRSNAINRFIATFNTTGATQFNVALSTNSDIQWIAIGN